MLRAVKGGFFAKLVFLTSIILGLGYLWPAWELNEEARIALDTGRQTVLLTWKGVGVWLLALYAAFNARSYAGWLLVLTMGLCALGDVLVESDQFKGGAAFMAGHVAATMLYLAHRRPLLTPSQKWLAIVLVPALALIGWLLTRDPGVLLYAVFLGMMATSAWTSRFPRYRVGAGAMLFVASDLLIFAEQGGWIGGALIAALIWLLYFAGQVLITTGVVNSLSD